MSLRIALAVFSALTVASAAAQSLEIINLRHRPAEQVLPPLQAIAGPHNAVTGSGFTLFLRADPATLADLRRAIATLDTPARQLLISVRSVDASRSSRVDIQAGGLIGARQATVVGSADAREQAQRQADYQQVRSLDGMPAWVSRAEQRFEPNGLVISGRRGTTVTPLLSPVDASTGFYVLPRVNGDTVLLEVSAQREAFAANTGAPPAVRGSALITQATGRLGEWIDVGGIDTQGSRNGGSIASINNDQQASSSRLQLKVDELK